MKKNFLILLLSLFFVSCATTTQFVKYPNKANVDNEAARIYVIRPSSFGSAVTFQIYQDEKLIGKLGPVSFLLWEVKTNAGAVKIESKSENTAMITIDPQPGKTYYVKQKVQMGVITARTKLELIPESEATEYLKKLKEPKLKTIE